MSMIHIQILFNIGALVDALDVGYKVLNIINRDTIDKLKPEYMSKEDFIGFVTDSVGYVALANVLLLVGNVQEFLKIVRSDLDFIPKSYDIFITLQDLLHGVKTNPTVQQIDANDRFGGVILHTINAFVNFTGDYKLFAEDIYRAKVIAKDNRLHQLELFCDLLIGYAYLQLESYKKADAIIYQIIKAANEKGMTTLLYIAWYVMSELHLRQHKYDVAFGIVNNSLIQLEKNNTTSEYLLMLFKYNMFKILMFKKQPDKAEICMGHAQYIAQKYGVNFIFDTDALHYIPIEEDNVEEAFTEPVSDTATATIDDLL